MRSLQPSRKLRPTHRQAQLFDLDVDPSERTDVREVNPEAAERLRQELRSLTRGEASATEAPLPSEEEVPQRRLGWVEEE
jgi:hypothetical protein